MLISSSNYRAAKRLPISIFKAAVAAPLRRRHRASLKGRRHDLTRCVCGTWRLSDVANVYPS